MKQASIQKFAISLLLLFIFGCEYERIAAPENECQSGLIVFSIEAVENTSCNEASGQIIVNGNSSYEYRINDEEFSTENIFSGLSAGTYTIQARDIESNCVGEEIEATINNEDGVQISLVEKNNSKCGESSGSIVVGREGGVEPIEYILNNNATQNVPEFTSLASGSYDILVRDANGCEAQISDISITSGISLSNDIRAIITTNCAVAGCHNGSQPPNLTADTNIIQNASRIKSRTGAGTMPPSSRPALTEAEIQAIACWVDDGALDN